MSSETALHKRELRQRLRGLMKTLRAPEGAGEDSLRACKILREQAAWKNARSVLFYAALPGELDLSSLHQEAVAAGKVIALPRFVTTTGTYAAFQFRDAQADCVAGQFGIAEPSSECAPIPLKRLDLVLTPGVGFAANGHRLGRGRGFYDRLLAEVVGIKCGVAFDHQIIAHIPGEKHDVPMNFILTPTRWLEIAEPQAIQT